MSRPGWDAYFLDMARAASTRSTCDRAHVGAVLVKDRQVISTGYNGAVSGADHCDDVGHLLVDGHCLRGLHAEEGAVIQAAKRGIETEGSECYITHTPCWHCFRILVQAGVSRIVFYEWKSNKLPPAVYEEMVKIVNKKEIEMMDKEGRLFETISKVVDGKVLPE